MIFGKRFWESNNTSKDIMEDIETGSSWFTIGIQKYNWIPRISFSIQIRQILEILEVVIVYGRQRTRVSLSLDLTVTEKRVWLRKNTVKNNRPPGMKECDASLRRVA